MPTDPSIPAIKQQASNVPYLIAAVVMVLISTIAVLVVVLFRPDKDNSAIMTIIGGFTVSAIPSVLSMMKAQETHLSVNSQMEDFKRDLADLSNIKSALANREGMMQGATDERSRVAVLARDEAAAKRTAQLAAMAQTAAAAPAAPAVPEATTSVVPFITATASAKELPIPVVVVPKLPEENK